MEFKALSVEANNAAGLIFSKESAPSFSWMTSTNAEPTAALFVEFSSLPGVQISSTTFGKGVAPRLSSRSSILRCSLLKGLMSVDVSYFSS